MDMKDIKVFLAVFEYQNMTKAAKALYLSPQSVSNTIQKLETEFNVTLFIRTASGSQPTQDALLLKSNAQKIIDDFKQLSRTFSENLFDQKILKIGAIPGAFRYLTIDFINAFQKKYPFIQLDIIEQHESIIEEACWNETVDLIINACIVNHLKFDSYLLFSQRYCLIIHESHPLAKKKFISVKDLDIYPIAILRCFDFHLVKFQVKGIVPNIIIKTSDMDFLADIAENNAGIGISIDYFTYKNHGEHTVVRYFDDDSMTWNGSILIKKNKKLSEEAILFIDFALEWTNQHQ